MLIKLIAILVIIGMVIAGFVFFVAGVTWLNDFTNTLSALGTSTTVKYLGAVGGLVLVLVFALVMQAQASHRARARKQ